jgi:hypothetical protein
VKDVAMCAGDCVLPLQMHIQGHLSLPFYRGTKIACAPMYGASLVKLAIRQTYAFGLGPAFRKNCRYNRMSVFLENKYLQIEWRCPKVARRSTYVWETAICFSKVSRGTTPTHLIVPFCGFQIVEDHSHDRVLKSLQFPGHVSETVLCFPKDTPTTILTETPAMWH